jgi:cytochrome c-type biogenesis protein CcmH/NrfG
MKKESVALGVAGVLFGFLAGWIIGAQQAPPAFAPAPAGQQAGAPEPSAGGPSPQGRPEEAPKFDQAKVDALRQRATDNPKDAGVRAEIGNAYFDAERYPEAITWYEASLGLQPGNVEVSTDLGVSYYYANQSDRALAQFSRSLEIDPKHTKTMLNIGVVRAFGKQDLTGAATVWQQVVDLAPESAEGRAARRMIDAVRQAHPDTGTSGPPSSGAGAPAPRSQGNGS